MVYVSAGKFTFARVGMHPSPNLHAEGCESNFSRCDAPPWHVKFFPLSQFAAATYCIPANSATSERNFSTSRLVANSKASQITPENLYKVVFVHNNYGLIEKNNFCLNDFAMILFCILRK